MTQIQFRGLSHPQQVRLTPQQVAPNPGLKQARPRALARQEPIAEVQHFNNRFVFAFESHFESNWGTTFCERTIEGLQGERVFVEVPPPPVESPPRIEVISIPVRGDTAYIAQGQAWLVRRHWPVGPPLWVFVNPVGQLLEGEAKRERAQRLARYVRAERAVRIVSDEGKAAEKERGEGGGG